MDEAETLNGLLVDWHKWARGYMPVATHSASAMFLGVRSSRQWDSETDVIDDDLHNSQMKTFDFHVGELVSTYQTALQLQARNLCTGRQVWTSARLPESLEERAIILRDAREALCVRLRAAGVL